jgi:hypothetical protein
MSFDTYEVDLARWRECEAEKPAVDVPVNVLLSDGRERLGLWSGSAWISAAREVSPVYWQPRWRT